MPDDETAIGAVSADRSPLAENESLKATLGAYLAAAVPHFYALIPLDTPLLHRLLGDRIGAPGSEFENSFMAGTAERPAGIVSSLPLERLPSAQQASTIALMRHIDRADMGAFRAAIAEYGKSVEPIEGSGEYLSRVTVAAQARGLGLGRKLVEQVVSIADGGDVWLHVDSDNQHAIRLYEKLGFEFASDRPYRSRAMRRAGERASR